jgi:hypothetical protein
LDRVGHCNFQFLCQITCGFGNELMMLGCRGFRQMEDKQSKQRIAGRYNQVSSMVTAFHQTTTRTSVASKLTSGPLQSFESLGLLLSHYIAAEHTPAIPTHPISSLAEASRSRARSVQLTAIQISFRESLRK